ncbi:hypothetical protein COU96_01670 [Candidatus Shapirobacteria bacterium CG10_big_fil_rev_8_21_14_0_10_38_14]|uniref:Uncharacterized protein n=1 Tax=Candidatus Shapirobacteria bacterium CG10_big_fil_rev_8_21_14_0_10_38_14 TaxID=1974483 RepID=A0A2M8L5M0_9BACT|nr:MAG: hypothetical protein COU96_01670 [Candidatus Shapirobacteria bacterium CG10_big_fil_rev_8_21_14_0_10_38_14]
MDKKEKFLQIYANLPLAVRNEIIVVLGDEPLTWNAARIEVENETKKGEEILKKLVEMGILNEEK